MPTLSNLMFLRFSFFPCAKSFSSTPESSRVAVDTRRQPTLNCSLEPLLPQIVVPDNVERADSRRADGQRRSFALVRRRPVEAFRVDSGPLFLGVLFVLLEDAVGEQDVVFAVVVLEESEMFEGLKEGGELE